jgi:hypothetical protein
MISRGHVSAETAQPVPARVEQTTGANLPSRPAALDSPASARHLHAAAAGRDSQEAEKVKAAVTARDLWLAALGAETAARKAALDTKVARQRAEALNRTAICRAKVAWAAWVAAEVEASKAERSPGVKGATAALEAVTAAWAAARVAEIEVVRTEAQAMAAREGEAIAARAAAVLAEAMV